MKEKIKILYDNNVISKETSDYCNEVIDYFSDKDVDIEKMDTFITHLAMASERTRKNEKLTDMPDEIFAQVKQDYRFAQASKYYEEISKFAFVSFPEDEYRFVIMHLTNMLKK